MAVCRVPCAVCRGPRRFGDPSPDGFPVFGLRLFPLATALTTINDHEHSLGQLYCPAIETDICYRPESEVSVPATAFHWAATCIEGGGGGGPDGGDPNGCGGIFQSQDCADTTLCSWDWDSTTCLPFTCAQADDGAQCAAVSDPAAPDGCIWLDESGICMAPGEEVSCQRFATCQQCPPGRCNFDGARQRCENLMVCSNIDEFTEAGCTAFPHCAWSNSNGCSDTRGGGGGGGCTAVGSQDHEQTCKDNSDSCIWTPTVFAVGPVTTASPVAPRICYDPPSAAPTMSSPTAAPSAAPATTAPTPAPTPVPTSAPTPAPTATPTTRDPTPSPTLAPTELPSGSPTPAPTLSPLTAFVQMTARPTADAAGYPDGDGDGDGPGRVGAGDTNPADTGDDENGDGMGSSSQDDSKKKDDGDQSGFMIIAAIVVGGLVLVGLAVITLLLRKRAKQRTQRAAQHAAHAAHTVAKNQAFEKEKAGQKGPSKGRANAQPKARPGQPKPKPQPQPAAVSSTFDAAMQEDISEA